MHHPHSINKETGFTNIPAPFLVSYAVTQKCNLKCKHCYSEATEEAALNELSTNEAKKLLDDIVELGVHLLIFDGGEPLYRDDFLELVRYASKKGLRTVIGSNGSLIDLEMAKNLKEAGVMAVQISLDGAKAETHDWFRGIEGSFEEALSGARACKEIGLGFQFGMTIRRGTLSEIPAMLQLAVDEGANAAELFDLIQVKRVKEKIPNEILTPLERKNIMEWLAETQIDYPIIIRTPACPMYPLILQEKNIQPTKFPSNMLERIPYYKRGCAAGMPKGYITILPNGDVIPCMLLQTILGNVRETPISEIWDNSPILIKLRNRDLLEGACGECEYKEHCAGCRGRAYEETGNIMATDPGCWLINKS